MELKTYYAQDIYGNIVANASVSVYEYGTANLASGLQDSSGDSLANPFTADSNGQISFAAPDGKYTLQVTSTVGTTYIDMTVQFLDVEAQVSAANDSATAAAASATAASASAVSASDSATAADSSASDAASQSSSAATSADTASTQASAAANSATAAAASATESAAAVDSLKTSLASSEDENGANLVEFIQSGAGATERTSMSKMRDVVSPFDYGAVGDGTTDDTAAFSALEVEFSGEIVDLAGKYFSVTSEPLGNRYENGGFILSKSISYNGAAWSYNWSKRRELVKPIPNNSYLLRDARTSMATNVFTFTQLTAVQGFCINEVNKLLFTTGLTTDSSGNEISFITQFSTAARGTLTASATSATSSVIGHQGIALEYLYNGYRLWTSVRYDATNYPNSGRQVARFSFSGTDGDAIANIQLYTLFGTEFADSTVLTNNVLPAISYGGKYLVAYGRKTTRDIWIRVFDLEMLINGGAGDYSDKFKTEFNVDASIFADDATNAFTPVQSMACDGAYVYLLAGTSSSSGTKKIVAYTIEGVYAGQNTGISLGAISGSLEPEGLTVYRPDYSAPPCLAVHYITGTSAARVNNIYALGYVPQVKTNYDAHGVGVLVPQSEWHISKQSSPTAITSLSANTMLIAQNDSGNVQKSMVGSTANATLYRQTFGPASDYSNGYITYRTGGTDGTYYYSFMVNGVIVSYIQNVSGALAFRPATDLGMTMGLAAARFSSVFSQSFMGSSGNGIIFGSGAPEGVTTASAPSLYFNTSGSSGSLLYIKSTGTGNTGWSALA